MQHECHIQPVAPQVLLSSESWPPLRFTCHPVCFLPSEGRKLGVTWKPGGQKQRDALAGTWEAHTVALPGSPELTFPFALHIERDPGCWAIVLGADYAVTLWAVWLRCLLSHEYWRTSRFLVGFCFSQKGFVPVFCFRWSFVFHSGIKISSPKRW